MLPTSVLHFPKFLACLDVNWDFKNRNSSIQYDEKTIKFQEVLYNWRDCVTNYSSVLVGGNTTTICDECGKTYESLFEFYWKIYTDPKTEFCVDVETTMNDTMHIWHKVWKCPDDTKYDRQHDSMMLIVSVGVLIIVLTLFYGGSYVQTERAQRNLIRCTSPSFIWIIHSSLSFALDSRLEAPRGQRSRLVSSSSFFSSPGVSVVTAVSEQANGRH